MLILEQQKMLIWETVRARVKSQKNLFHNKFSVWLCDLEKVPIRWLGDKNANLENGKNKSNADILRYPKEKIHI